LKRDEKFPNDGHPTEVGRWDRWFTEENARSPKRYFKRK
jgi:hypothetical protein